MFKIVEKLPKAQRYRNSELFNVAMVFFFHLVHNKNFSYITKDLQGMKDNSLFMQK